MSSNSEENKKIAVKFFDLLSSGSEEYLDFYCDDSIIWTAGENAIGGKRSKKVWLIDPRNALMDVLEQQFN